MARKTKAKISQEIAKLESLNDQLLTEIGDIDALMRLVGFSQGIETVKATAEEIIRARLTP